VVDDCAPDNTFDGALQAYEEFLAKTKFRSEIVCGKLGVIYF
jgi:hypothetical protein